MEFLQTTLSTLASVLAAMAAVALLEALLPLRERGASYRAHLGPNLALTLITFATSTAFGSALVLALEWMRTRELGVIPWLALPPLAATVLVVLALDLAFYLLHVAMHRIPSWWRFHAVHHSDPALDVSSTLRQHPGESLLRFAAISAFALPLGASPEAFAVYRALAVVTGLLEHANFRLPPRFEAALSWIFTWPTVHKVHHSRFRHFTNSNYGNIVSLWDRAFGTFTHAREGRSVVYGLAGFDAPAVHTTAALLSVPFRTPEIARERSLA
jgi:sterol desaturase/sphingolipid hydroxylase (fatty acid hydroxylase superfamily)